MTGEISKYRDFFEADAETFRFLSQVFFKELTPAVIEQLSQSEWPEDTGNANLDAGYAAVKRYFAFGVPDRRQQLAVEYARIFLAAGVFSKEVRTAIPYESVFTSEEHVMMGDSRDDAVARFREDGFAVAESLHEPEDHLSFELEYLQVMCERALGFVESGDAEGLARNAKRQRAFIETHILNWVPLLLDVAREYATLTFYTGMLQIAIGTAEAGEAPCAVAAGIVPSLKHIARDTRTWVLVAVVAAVLIAGFPIFCLVCPIGLTFGTVGSLWHLIVDKQMTMSVIVFPLALVVELVLYRKWCLNLCPIAGLLGIAGQFARLFRPRVNAQTCLRYHDGVNCNVCTAACSERIDLHRADAPQKLGECTRCGECAAQCPTASIALGLMPSDPVVHDAGGE